MVNKRREASQIHRYGCICVANVDFKVSSIIIVPYRHGLYHLRGEEGCINEIFSLFQAQVPKKNFHKNFLYFN